MNGEIVLLNLNRKTRINIEWRVLRERGGDGWMDGYECVCVCICVLDGLSLTC